MPLEKKYQISLSRKPKGLNTHYIFVSGGVMSALGKGVTSASVALLLKRRGYKVCPIKCENNLNVDFGTLNPIEHGDPFLCFDGLEADQDLGNYERFLDRSLVMINNYEVNYFKYDGFGGSEPEYLPDMEAGIRLMTELRRHDPDIFLNITVGSWPSPFWLK